jgi:glycosyltransferase involved in cell wall biosynthesis
VSRIEHVAVVLPARNEEELMSRSLASIARAQRTCRRHLGSRSPDFSIIVVADGCTDDTAGIAARHGATVLETPPIGVGAARALGVAEALSRFGASPEVLWLANTDADSAVHGRWILEQWEAADAGADVYLGDVRPDFEDLSPQQREAWLATHRPGRARGHVHGASLGIRASTYLAIGGFDAIEVGEDVELVAAARKAGYAVAVSATEILTSGRAVARAVGGYSHYLTADLLRQALDLSSPDRGGTSRSTLRS